MCYADGAFTVDSVCAFFIVEVVISKIGCDLNAKSNKQCKDSVKKREGVDFDCKRKTDQHGRDRRNQGFRAYGLEPDTVGNCFVSAAQLGPPGKL